MIGVVGRVGLFDALLFLTTLFVFTLHAPNDLRCNCSISTTILLYNTTMPVSTSSRSSTAYSTAYSTPTPSRSHPSWPMSPPSVNSYSPTVTSAGQVLKMNIVTRVVVEGKANQGQDGASIKMYMKVRLFFRNPLVQHKRTCPFHSYPFLLILLHRDPLLHCFPVGIPSSLPFGYLMRLSQRKMSKY